MQRNQPNHLESYITHLLKIAPTPRSAANVIIDQLRLLALEPNELNLALEILEENIKSNKKLYDQAILEKTLSIATVELEGYKKSVSYAWTFEQLTKLAKKIIKFNIKLESILRFTAGENEQLKEMIAATKKHILRLAAKEADSSSAYIGCKIINEMLATISCDAEDVQKCFSLYSTLCVSLYNDKKRHDYRNPEYMTTHELIARQGIEQILDSIKEQTSTLTDPVRKKHFVKLVELIDDEMRAHYPLYFRAYHYFDRVPKEYQTLERQRIHLCLTFEVALHTTWGQSQSPEEFLLHVYDYLNDTSNSAPTVSRKCLQALVGLPQSLTGINQKDLACTPNDLMDCDVDQFAIYKTTALQALRKHLLKTNAANIQRNIGIGSVAKNLEQEYELFRRWLGVTNSILENLDIKDVSSKNALEVLKNKTQSCIERGKFRELFNIMFELKNDVVTAPSIKVKLDSMMSLMESGNLPTDEIYQEIARMSAAREEFAKLRREFEIVSEAIAAEFSILQSRAWAPQTCLAVKKEWDEILDKVKKFSLTMENDSSSPEVLTVLRNFLQEMKDFPNANEKFKLLRCVKEVYAQYGVNPESMAYTYLKKVSQENHIPEVTFDIVKLYLKNKIVSSEKNSQPTKEISLLLKRIEEAVNMDAVLMAVYDYLADFQKQKTATSEKLEETLLNVLLNIPENETSISQSSLPHGALNGSIIKSNILQQLQRKLAAVQHDIRVGETTISLTLSKEISLLKKWKGIAITIGEKLTQNDFARFVLFRNTVNIVDIQKEIENAESYSELFCVLQKLRKLCTSNNLQSTLDSTLSNMSKGIDPTEKAIKIILAEENFNELFDKLSKQIENLQNEFDSWNGVLWDIVNNSFVSSDQNLTSSMGSLVEKEIQALRESKDKIIARKKYLATGQLTIEKLLSEAKVLSGKIETFSQSESFKTLRQEKLAEDEKKDLSKLVKETNKKSAIEMINRIAKIQRHIFITPQQRDELAKYTEFATRIVSDACVQSDDEIYKLLQKCNKKIESIDNDCLNTYDEFKNTIDELNKKRSELENANLSTEMRNQVTELKLESQRLVKLARTHNFDKDKIAQISTKLDELKILQINLEANHSAHSVTAATPYTSLGQDDEVSISKPENMQISIATNQSTFFSESTATAYASIGQGEAVSEVQEPKRIAAAATGG